MINSLKELSLIPLDRDSYLYLSSDKKHLCYGLQKLYISPELYDLIFKLSPNRIFIYEDLLNYICSEVCKERNIKFNKVND